MTKRIYRDSLFRSYFSIPENFVQLCNAVTGLNLTADEVTENTVEDILFSNPRNDVSFSAGNYCFIFFEHQSTRNFNMPIRMLYYLTVLYRSIVPDDLIYKEKQIKLPAPKFFVFYNGNEPCPEKSVMKLSDAFSMAADVKLTVDVYNVKYNKNFSLLRECRPIHDYSYFINAIEVNRRAVMNLHDAMITAIQMCIDEDIMRDYLKDRRWEVFELLNLVWNEEDAHRSYYAQGMEDGIEKGIEQGKAKTKLEMVKNLLLARTPMKYIIQATGWTKEEIMKISAELK
ncbi:MAG: Rpn family recombination-promoting nuclease/putative transposase [Selenomonadaceae bacterium]|nr:Rpn family recombination-promoting nuclease/putative transposase [Selenomonadaceae bacterium]